MTTNCSDCRVRQECHDSEKGMTCEEFKTYMEELDVQFFREVMQKEIDENEPNKLY